MASTTRIAPVAKTIFVNTPPPHAFTVFTGRMGRWWNPAHSISATNSPIKDVVIEPRVDGRWYEKGEDGCETDWGKVLVWEPPSRLVLAWQLNGQWAFDRTFVTELEIQFTAVPGGTRVDLEHRDMERFGEVAKATRGAFDSNGGWQGLLDRFVQEAAAYDEAQNRN